MMAKRPALIPQADVTRILRGAVAAGFPNPRVEIEPGKVVLIAENPPAPPAAEPAKGESNPWDEIAS